MLMLHPPELVDKQPRFSSPNLNKFTQVWEKETKLYRGVPARSTNGRGVWGSSVGARDGDRDYNLEMYRFCPPGEPW
jgi:hypothetical protein